MNRKVKKVMQQINLLVLLFVSTIVVAKAQYTLTSDDVVVVDGVIESCSYDFAITDIVIPATLDGQTVVGIKDGNGSLGVFYNKGITNITLPVSLTSIGAYAFGKNSLTNLDLSTCISLTFIGIKAFSLNSGLNSFALPGLSHPDFLGWSDNSWDRYKAEDIVTEFGRSYHARFPYTLTDDDVVVVEGIIQSCFYDSLASRDIIIPEFLDGQTVTEIRARGTGGPFDGVFYGKHILSVVLPSTIISIGGIAFYYNSLESVDLSACEVLNTIDYDAFDMNSLTSLDLSACAKLLSIHSGAFRSNSLVDITLPNSLTHIGAMAFNHNKISIINGTASDGIIYARNTDASIDYTTIVSYGGALANVIIPSQVETIGLEAFFNTDITGLDLSDCTSLKSIQSRAFYSNSINSLDLSNCTALRYIGTSAFASNNITEFTLPTPNIQGFEFNFWLDKNANEFAGGAIVNDLYTQYNAKLISVGFSDPVSSKLIVHPNPVTDILIITKATEDIITHIELYSLQGQKFQLNTLVNNQELIKIDVQGLEQGTYILKCYTHANKVLSTIIMKE